jgi:DNA modification methylase
MTEQKIFHCDCLKGFKKIDDASVDFILADYPFNCQDGRTDYFGFVERTAKEFFRILKDGGNLLVINNPINIYKTAHLYHDFNFRNGIALIRPGSLRPAYMLGFQHNYALLLYKGEDKKAKWGGVKQNHDESGMTDVIQYQNGYRGKKGAFHPQAIPLELTETFVRMLSKKKDLVCDPFSGSGSTPLACKKLDRNFIGFEINKLYHKMIEERMMQEPLSNFFKG